MKKNIVVIFIIIFIILLGGAILKEKDANKITEKKEGEQIKKIDIEPTSIPSQTLPLSYDLKTEVWNVFQKYLSYNKERNLEGIKSIVHKLSLVCTDEKTKLDCQNRMALAYQYGSVLKIESFKNIWSDEKQVILSSDFWEEEGRDTKDFGRYRAIIFFVKNETGEWKLLSFSPFKGALTSIGEASLEEVRNRITRYTEDNDMDGRSDYNEECLDTKEEDGCQKSNSKIRDSDGNGWWDGIEILF